MRKQLLLLFAFLGLIMISCDDNDDDEGDALVANLKITAEVDGNKVSVTASADNALSYSWDFGNGLTGSGSSSDSEYLIAGKYYIKCTANGQKNKVTDSTEVDVDGDPEVYNEVAKLLCGYNETTNESSAVWYWGAGKPGMVTGGFKGHYFEHDSAEYDFFDPIDETWWSGEGPMDESLDDEYSFKLNKTLDYSCAYKETGFVHNWAWAAYTEGMSVEQYGDVALFSAPKTGSWKITKYRHNKYADFTAEAPKTIVNGVELDTAYVLTLTGGAYLMQATGVAEYQILRIDQDTIKLRMDLAFPKDLDLDPNWPNPEWITPGEGEWGYVYLVKNPTTPEGK